MSDKMCFVRSSLQLLCHTVCNMVLCHCDDDTHMYYIQDVDFTIWFAVLIIFQHASKHNSDKVVITYRYIAITGLKWCFAVTIRGDVPYQIFYCAVWHIKILQRVLLWQILSYFRHTCIPIWNVISACSYVFRLRGAMQISFAFIILLSMYMKRNVANTN